jgi:hypothetical protein
MFVMVTTVSKPASYFIFKAQGMAQEFSVSWVSWLFDNGKKSTFTGSAGTLKTVFFIMDLVTA